MGRGGRIALLSFVCLLYDAISTKKNVVLYSPPTEMSETPADDVNVSHDFLTMSVADVYRVYLLSIAHWREARCE